MDFTIVAGNSKTFVESNPGFQKNPGGLCLLRFVMQTYTPQCGGKNQLNADFRMLNAGIAC